ncbi:MAG: 3-hydroxyacyl-CoA dehydrogenase family protein, partial [Deltaproteobacteria bacterium]|nr:3-hydroxyacyl-CoA dehydrogenase family protein [Deltaproteobacteria bacterium]
VIIAHWYAPPHIIPLVDVVKGPGTSRDTVHRVVGWLREMGKHPVVLKKFIPGFIVNRIQRAIGREVLSLLARGVFDPEEIDEAVRWSLGIRLPVLGVVRRIDYAGVDLARNVLRNPSIHLADTDDDARNLLEEMIAEGRLGVKSGRGFFDYCGRAPEELMKERDLELLKWLRVMDGGENDPG